MKVGSIYEISVPGRKKPVKMVLTSELHLFGKEEFGFKALSLGKAGRLYSLHIRQTKETLEQITRQ